MKVRLIDYYRIFLQRLLHYTVLSYVEICVTKYSFSCDEPLLINLFLHACNFSLTERVIVVLHIIYDNFFKYNFLFNKLPPSKFILSILNA
jgi:hypothetical protein